ncbi:hypothetical protein DdX_21460 [Ditylenchus destructor]|uniref:Uncharacterized protein n=1 Tax=Ditylenchus destructor TaxID=166010 RepID=A0AAD4MFS2_9BILA|nr:hypothetical protein DdX_21460 [Ditylenchus destructor]
MLRHPGFQCGQPVRVGGFVRAEQPVALAHRRFVARCVMRMTGCQRQRQPVEEAPPLARRLDEQPVHRRGQPEHRQPFGEAVAAAAAPLTRTTRRSGAEACVPHIGLARAIVAGQQPRSRRRASASPRRDCGNR